MFRFGLRLKRARKEKAMPTTAEITGKLKDNMEATERLRIRRKEIKTALNRESLLEKEEAELAKELESVCNAIEKLDADRKRLCDELLTATP